MQDSTFPKIDDIAASRPMQANRQPGHASPHGKIHPAARATRTIGAMLGSSNPARRNAASSLPVFHSRYGVSSQCCEVQPPH
jgi:hypothetical protein